MVTFLGAVEMLFSSQAIWYHSSLLSGFDYLSVLLQPDDSVMVLFGNDRYESKLPERMRLCEAKDIVTQAFGITGGAREQSAIVKDDIFNRPSLNFLLAVHGLGNGVCPVIC